MGKRSMGGIFFKFEVLDIQKLEREVWECTFFIKI